VKAVDARLLRWGRPTRIYLVASVGLGTVRAVLLVAQAWLLATVITGAFMSRRDLAQLRTQMELLLAVVVLRATVAWASEWSANRCSARVKSMLRARLVRRASVPGPDGQAVTSSGDLATLATRGLDALDGYFARYLPQVFLSVIVPLTILVVVLRVDWISAAIMAVTLPLIPVFMALIGIATKTHTDRQLRALEMLAGHFLDVVRGLTTLKIFGRSKAQVKVIEDVSNSYRRRLMTTLRVTFLSSLALELLASLSVAVIAVAIGIRLLNGHMHLHAGLFVLVLAPEAYLPLRQLGADYHASAEGLSAADQVFGILDRPEPPRGTRLDIPDPAEHALVVDSLCFTYPGRRSPALREVNLEVAPGEVVAVAGPSGCGKSTLLSILLGLIRPDAGTVLVGDADLADLDPDAWRCRVAWVPQHPHIFAATIAENVRLGRKGATDIQVRRAIADAGLADLVDGLPLGLHTPLGEGGAGLSAGELQRVALARAFLRDASLLLLDEPTANLDGRTEAEIVETVGRLAGGRTALIVAHRPALLALADRVVDLSRAEALV
jgi:ATP-binding cassette, subfamily C, bacterial CydCD